MVVTEILLPAFAMALTQGTITRWLKNVGDSVEAGEPLAEVDESKTTGEVTSSKSGYLLKILVQEGETVRVRTPLCLIGTREELQSQIQPVQATLTTSQAASAPAVTQPASTWEPKAQLGKSVQVTPVARKLAIEYKIDLSTLQGSGPEGRITEDDIRRIHAERSVTNETEIPLSSLRGMVAQRMLDSLHNSAQITLSMQADVTELLLQHDALKASKSVNNNGTPAPIINVTLTDVIVKATALTLKKHQRLNGWVEDGKIRLPADINIGLAVAIKEGLVVPVVHNADQKTLREIAAENKSLAQKARGKILSPEEISGSTFTISNLGMYGVDFFTPIINTPEIAILGVGAVIDFPVRQGDYLAWHKGLPLSLTFDHCVVDGVPAAVFLRDLRDCLEHIDLKLF